MGVPYIIAHRLSTVRAADRIIVVDHGKIVESGDHTSLIKSQGYYAKFYSYQNHIPEIRGHQKSMSSESKGSSNASDTPISKNNSSLSSATVEGYSYSFGLSVEDKA